MKTLLLALLLSHPALAANLCSIAPTAQDTSKYNVELNGKTVSAKTKFSEASRLLGQLMASKQCTDVSDATKELVNADCTAMLCGDGDDSCMLPCQCNGMQCVVY
jgi:hypothetical protein